MSSLLMPNKIFVKKEIAKEKNTSLEKEEGRRLYIYNLKAAQNGKEIFSIRLGYYAGA